ncbi:MAG: acyl-CoA/acyl-ACP dehydrogenase [Proteobacteria bacterium]|nr:acyl-CoA/acyl-ACP dehydrogenase [Pseudomonadota bacterium]
MNFDLSEEQLLLQETVGQFVANECPPTRLRELFDADDGFDSVLWKGMIELGLGGITLPDEFGGAGLEMLDMAVVSEVLGHACAPGPFVPHSLAGLAIALGGSDEQKQRWLPRLASGETLGTVAICESGDRWQLEEWALAADGTLTGEKLHVPFASNADLLVVGVAGGGLVLVERDSAGVSVEEIEGADRTRRLFRVTFDGASCEPLPEGVAAAPRLRDAGLVLLAADAFGAARRLVDMSVEYAQTREQFGVTIGHFQALKHQLADMAVEVEPCRGLYWYAAHAFDHVAEEAERSAALAKSHITDRAMQVARDAVEAHGGIGFTWECDVQIWFKRVMFDRAFLGAPAFHRERVAQLAGW